MTDRVAFMCDAINHNSAHKGPPNRNAYYQIIKVGKAEYPPCTLFPLDRDCRPTVILTQLTQHRPLLNTKLVGPVSTFVS